MTKNVLGTFIEIPEWGREEAMTAKQQEALRVIREKAELSANGFRAVAHAITKGADMEWLPNQPVITKAQASVVIDWYAKTPEVAARSVENRVIGEAAGQGGLF